MHIFVAKLLKCNFCNHFHVHPPTISARDFSREVCCSVTSHRYYSTAACKKKLALATRVHPPGICHDRFLYLSL